MPPSPYQIDNNIYLVKRQGQEVIQVEKKKMGRPTNNPKSYRESFRLSEIDMKKINFCMEKAGMSKTDVIRVGIDEVYQKLKK